MKQYNSLFSQEFAALYQLSHTDPDKIDQHLACLAHAIPRQLIPIK